MPIFPYYIGTFFFFLSICQWFIGLGLFYRGLEVICSWRVFNPQGRILSFYVYLDSIGVLFSAVVLLISARVFIFSSFYMAEEIFLRRFIMIVILFVLSINLLIFIPHLMALLLGWDGLGLVSFYLVIYYQNSKSLRGGILTALTNRIGDALILLSIAFLLDQGEWLIINIFSEEYGKLLGFMLIIAAITKRAQLPFSRWLPAAIAAPTPVSALVHSSTLVTAGVFLLIRFYSALALVEGLFYYLLLLSSLTILIAGIAAVVETDIKKVIALSTLSQLGVIIFSLASGLPLLAFFHLLTHALFKALLFLAAGALIHLFSHVQDLRSLGNLRIQVPIVSAAILASNLALIGFPFLAGFYSKDVILEHIIERSCSGVLVFIGLGATILTAVYSVRLIIRVLWSTSENCLHAVEDDIKFLLVPLVLISIGAIMGGGLLNWLLLVDLRPPVIRIYYKVLPLVLVLWGRWITWSLSQLISSIVRIFIKKKVVLHAVARIWFFTPISTQPLVYLGKEVGGVCVLVLDQGWLELSGGQGLIRGMKSWFSIFQTWRRNKITIMVVVGLIVFLPLKAW